MKRIASGLLLLYMLVMFLQWEQTVQAKEQEDLCQDNVTSVTAHVVADSSEKETIADGGDLENQKVVLKTGDKSGFAGWLILVIVSGIGILVTKKKKTGDGV